MTGATIHIPTIETANLRLRAPNLADFEQYAGFRGSERARVLGGPYSRAEAFDQLGELIGHWHLRGYGRWMVDLTETGETVGNVGLWNPAGWPEPEIGWDLFAGHEGRGYATEATQAVVDLAFADTGATAVWCSNRVSNSRARRVIEKCGGVLMERYLTTASLGAKESLRYRIALPEDAGGHVLTVTDWLYLTANGTIMNRSELRKYGIKVAELVATMRPAN